MYIRVLWFIGSVITVVTAFEIRTLTDEIESKDEYFIESRSKRTQVIMNVLAIICIVLVGGIADGFLIATILSDGSIIFRIIMTILIAFVTYVVGFMLLGLYHFKSELSQLCFIVVFIISIIGWTISISNYDRNIETITETTITSTQERKLLYFCNIPVQEISGYISGSRSSVSGNISTSDELPYWYANENNEGKYDSAPSSSSKIVFISDEEKPYLEIISYCTYTKTINHNNSKEDTKTDKEWEEYIFYLPEAIMQYSLN